MTDRAGTPGSSGTTEKAGQAAYEAMALHSLSDDGPPGRSAGWDALEPWQHGRWEAAARAAIAAAAPAPAGEASAPHCPPSMHVDCEWPKCATVITTQPQAAPGADAGPTCPCCSARLRIPEYDGPFCWSCGLDPFDNPANCDNEEHARQATRKAGQ